MGGGKVIRLIIPECDVREKRDNIYIYTYICVRVSLYVYKRNVLLSFLW